MGKIPNGPDTIALLIADVDGTLLTPEKVLTPNAAAAVRRLADASILFTLISSRPPRGMTRLVEALAITLPFAAFNGGTLIGPGLRDNNARRLSSRAARVTLDLLTKHNVDIWVFANGDWMLRDPSRPHVANHQRTVGFAPVIVEGFDDVIDRMDKIVGVSDRPDLLAGVEAKARALLGGQATIVRSQDRYLDVTHPEANKGSAVRTMCAILGVDLRQVAVLGDMMNDVAMFKVAGYAIAMGQAPDTVKAHADAVTGSNADNGFAAAVNRLVLPRASRRDRT